MHQDYTQMVVSSCEQEWNSVTYHYQQNSEMMKRSMPSHRLNSKLKLVLVHMVIVIWGLVWEHKAIILYKSHWQYYQVEFMAKISLHTEDDYISRFKTKTEVQNSYSKEVLTLWF